MPSTVYMYQLEEHIDHQDKIMEENEMFLKKEDMLLSEDCPQIS